MDIQLKHIHLLSTVKSINTTFDYCHIFYVGLKIITPELSTKQVFHNELNLEIVWHEH